MRIPSGTVDYKVTCSLLGCDLISSVQWILHGSKDKSLEYVVGLHGLGNY